MDYSIKLSPQKFLLTYRPVFQLLLFIIKTPAISDKKAKMPRPDKNKFV